MGGLPCSKDDDLKGSLLSTCYVSGLVGRWWIWGGGEIASPEGCLTISRDLNVTTGEAGVRHWPPAESGDSEERPTMPRTVPTEKNYPAPKVNGVEAEKPFARGPKGINSFNICDSSSASMLGLLSPFSR